MELALCNYQEFYSCNEKKYFPFFDESHSVKRTEHDKHNSCKVKNTFAYEILRELANLNIPRSKISKETGLSIPTLYLIINKQTLKPRITTLRKLIIFYYKITNKTENLSLTKGA